MNTVKYEHHSSGLFMSELCPFKIKYINTQKSIGANWHTNPEIIYVTQGEGKFVCTSEAIPAKKGDIFVVSPETIHQMIAAKDLGYYFIITDVSFWTENGLDPSEFLFQSHITDDITESLIKDVISSFESICSDQTNISAAILRSRVLSLIIDICKNHAAEINGTQKTESKSSDNYVKTAMQFINENYQRPLTTVEIAEKVGITQSYLSREFKRCTGETVVTYINILRCKRAGQLIMRGHSVTEAALECGFENGSYFSQIYKKITGKSPKDVKGKDERVSGVFGVTTEDDVLS